MRTELPRAFCLEVPGRKLGSKVRMSGLVHLRIYGVYWGYSQLNNLLLTFWDIQVGDKRRFSCVKHPKKWYIYNKHGTYFEVIYVVTLLVYEETKHTVPPKKNANIYNIYIMSFLGGHALVLSMSVSPMNQIHPPKKRSGEKSPSPRSIDYGNRLNCKSVIQLSFLSGPPRKFLLFKVPSTEHDFFHKFLVQHFYSMTKLFS